MGYGGKNIVWGIVLSQICPERKIRLLGSETLAITTLHDILPYILSHN